MNKETANVLQHINDNIAIIANVVYLWKLRMFQVLPCSKCEVKR